MFRLRYFRSEDRNIHERSYPQLHYPEIYLLEGGYKGFYEYSKVRICCLRRKNNFISTCLAILFTKSISNDD
jgi:hypothetical protein